MFSVDGLVSGLDTSSIVESALSLQNARIDRLNLDKQEILAEQTAFKTIEGNLLALQGSLRNILRSANNAFDNKTASSSDEERIIASATSQATPGTYQLQVTSLAQAHQLASSTFASASDEINQGTLTLQLGNRAEANITIDETNNTWQGLVDSINSSTNDVQATILDDGSGSATPLRVLLTSTISGAEHVINVTNGLSGAATQPDFTGPAVQDAADAQVQIGSGPGAITVSSAENEFTQLIPGTTIDALTAEPGKEVTVTVEADTEQVVSAVQGFVDAYNAVVEFIDQNSRYDTESNSAGLLLGNRSASSVLDRIRGAISQVVQGVNDKMNSLGTIGISTEDNGRLSLNSSELREIVAGEREGVGIDDIRRLFAIDGQSDNPGIEFLLGTNNTQPSPIDPDTNQPIPYEVEITGVAKQASILAATSLAPTTVIDDLNDAFKLEIDTVELTLMIPHGSYTASDLATQLETLINTSSERQGRSSTVEVLGGNLSITSDSVGSSSTLEILDGSANSVLGLAQGDASTGSNVAGVFRITPPGGTTITEQAVGNGRTLAGESDNEYTAQLQIRSTLQENQIGASTDAYLTVTKGLGATLDAAISALLEQGTTDTSKGQLVTTQERLTRQIESIDANIERVEAQIEARRESLLREFAALESTLAELQSVGSALTSSLGTLSL